MHIFIDESGTFSKAHRPHSISAVGALVVPSSRLKYLERRYARVRSALPIENGEVKGRLLSEDHINEVVSFLLRHDVVFDVTAIDMGLHNEATIRAHQWKQAALITSSLTNEHHATVRDGAADLRLKLEQTSPQLYVQSLATFDLIYRVISHGTMYFSQRRPAELGKFSWVIDGKEREQVTDWEKWWSYVVMPMLQSKSMRQPMPYLIGADYSYFGRFDAVIDAYLAKHYPDLEGQEATNIRLLLTEDFRFSSVPEPGLELVDILTNATKRALSGNLKISGWRDLRRLMIHQKSRYIHIIALGDLTSAASSAPYRSVLRHFAKDGKSMLVPRLLNTD